MCPNIALLDVKLKIFSRESKYMIGFSFKLYVERTFALKDWLYIYTF